MNLRGRTLDDWLANAPDSAFPKHRRVDYASSYRVVETFMRESVHPHVVPMAALHDHAEGGYLTGHGAEHIEAVIARASDLASAAKLRLSAQEVFYLLVAIQIHDVGMLFAGRVDHELNAERVLKDIENRASIDSIEARLIFQIAQAHSGTADPIGALPEEREGLRLQLLAAILRFADELSEDKQRAARYLLDNALMRPASEVFHLYAQSLREVSVQPSEKQVRLSFEIAEPWVSNKAQKKDKHIYLLDEIFNRTLKMHTERTYCMRFMRPWIEIDSIEVTIGVYNEKYRKPLRKDIKYTLTERGYPTVAKGGIHALCDTLRSGRTALTGDRLRLEVQRSSQND